MAIFEMSDQVALTVVQCLFNERNAWVRCLDDPRMAGRDGAHKFIASIDAALAAFGVQVDGDPPVPAVAGGFVS